MLGQALVPFSDLRQRPEFSKRRGPSAVDDTLAGAIAHALALGGIDNQLANGADEIIGVVRSGDEASLVLTHQFFWAAGIGNNNWNARGLSFDDDVAEGVGRAWENEDV